VKYTVSEAAFKRFQKGMPEHMSNFIPAVRKWIADEELANMSVALQGLSNYWAARGGTETLRMALECTGYLIDHLESERDQVARSLNHLFEFQEKHSHR
jgi:hypothetical protein